MPYAHGATIEHEFDTDHLNVWLTFRHPMDQDVKPAHNLWTLTVDDVEKAISGSAWQDEFTLLLVSDAVVVYPDRVLLAYDGPSGNLQTTWGKDWEPWGPKLSTDIGKAPCFVYRGDPAAFDFEIGDFTKDGAWHDLDLSAIIPENSKGVALFIILRATAVGRYIALRRGGQTNSSNQTYMLVQVAGVMFTLDVIVPIDSNRIIQYKIHAGVDQRCDLTVKAWWF